MTSEYVEGHAVVENKYKDARNVKCKTNTIPILMHQMSISTTQIKSLQ
jgi:hypothetical protein